MTISNRTKGIILFAVIYFSVFFMAFGVSAFRTSLIANPVTSASTSAALPTPTASHSESNIWLLVGEIAVVTIIAIAEMKWKAVSRIHARLKYLFRNVHPAVTWVLLGLLWLAILAYVWVGYGFVWFLFVAINGTGVLVADVVLMKKLTLIQRLPVFATFLWFFFMWVFVVLMTEGSSGIWLELLVEFAYFPLAYAVSALVMRDPTKDKKNAVAFLFSLTVPLFMGLLFTPYFAVVLLALFAVYDLIAVFKTGHMQFMARYLIAWNIPEVFIIGDMQLIAQRMAELKKGIRTKIPNAKRPLIVGVGDAVLPAAVMAAFVFGHLPVFGLAAAIGGTIGIFFNMRVLAGYKKVIPALPLILIGILLMLAVAWGVQAGFATAILPTAPS